MASRDERRDPASWNSPFSRPHPEKLEQRELYEICDALFETRAGSWDAASAVSGSSGSRSGPPRVAPWAAPVVVESVEERPAWTADEDDARVLVVSGGVAAAASGAADECDVDDEECEAARATARALSNVCVCVFRETIIQIHTLRLSPLSALISVKVCVCVCAGYESVGGGRGGRACRCRNARRRAPRSPLPLCLKKISKEISVFSRGDLSRLVVSRSLGLGHTHTHRRALHKDEKCFFSVFRNRLLCRIPK